MDVGDHSACIVELRECPKHRDEQLRRMGEVDTSDLVPYEVQGGPVAPADEFDQPSIGFCLWCNRDFYTLDEVWTHNGKGVDSCKTFEQFMEDESTRNQAPSKADES